MSSIYQQTRNTQTTDNHVTVFRKRDLGLYPLSRIYDPVTNNGKGTIIPAVGSQVIDDIKGNHNRLYTVIAVDPTTYASTLTPTVFLDEKIKSRKISGYTNDLFMLYFKKETIKNENGHLEEIYVVSPDERITIFGEDAYSYQIWTIEDVPITRYLGDWEDWPGQHGPIPLDPHWAGSYPEYNQYVPESDHVIPLAPLYQMSVGEDGFDTTEPYAKKCVPSCITYIHDAPLKTGDLYLLKIFDKTNIIIAELTLVACESEIPSVDPNEDLDIKSRPTVIDFDVVCNQMEGNVIILRRGQDPYQLQFTGIITYSDGSQTEVPLDGDSGFVYGLEEVSSEIPNIHIPILFKYYLPFAQPVYLRENVSVTDAYNQITEALGENSSEGEQAVQDFYESTKDVKIGSSRYISCMKYIYVTNTVDDVVNKVSLIPIWSESKWLFKVLGYRFDRTGVMTFASDDVSIEDAENVGVSFNTMLPNDTEQKFIIKIDDTSNGVVEIQQLGYIKLKNPASRPDMLFTIRDAVSKNNYVYGQNDGYHHRPFIFADVVEGVTEYKIPVYNNGAFVGDTSITDFDNESDYLTYKRIQIFLTTYYYDSNPPMLISEANPPKPTHFRVMGWKNGQYEPVATVENDGTAYEYIPVELYYKPLTLTVDPSNIESTWVIEFYRVANEGTATESYETLYGNPVTVHTKSELTEMDTKNCASFSQV